MYLSRGMEFGTGLDADESDVVDRLRPADVRRAILGVFFRSGCELSLGEVHAVLVADGLDVSRRKISDVMQHQVRAGRAEVRGRVGSCSTRRRSASRPGGGASTGRQPNGHANADRPGTAPGTALLTTLAPSTQAGPDDSMARRPPLPRVPVPRYTSSLAVVSAMSRLRIVSWPMRSSGPNGASSTRSMLSRSGA